MADAARGLAILDAPLTPGSWGGSLCRALRGGGGLEAAGAGVGDPDQVAVAGDQDLAASAAYSVAQGGGRQPRASQLDLHAFRSATRTQRV